MNQNGSDTDANAGVCNSVRNLCAVVLCDVTMICKRERRARRADKFWSSVYLTQLLMGERT